MTNPGTSSFEEALPGGTLLVYQSYTDDFGLLKFYFPAGLHGALVFRSVAEQVRTRAQTLHVDADPRIVFADLVPGWEY